MFVQWYMLYDTLYISWSYSILFSLQSLTFDMYYVTNSIVLKSSLYCSPFFIGWLIMSFKQINNFVFIFLSNNNVWSYFNSHVSKYPYICCLFISLTFSILLVDLFLQLISICSSRALTVFFLDFFHVYYFPCNMFF